MAIDVLKPGLATSVQDAGRIGYYHLGIPLSGALDQASYLLANLLVGHEETAAVLECTLLAPELRFVGRKIFEGPSVSLAADPGPLVDSAPTTLPSIVGPGKMSPRTRPRFAV